MNENLIVNNARDLKDIAKIIIRDNLKFTIERIDVERFNLICESYQKIPIFKCDIETFKKELYRRRSQISKMKKDVRKLFDRACYLKDIVEIIIKNDLRCTFKTIKKDEKFSMCCEDRLDSSANYSMTFSFKNTEFLKKELRKAKLKELTNE